MLKKHLGSILAWLFLTLLGGVLDIVTGYYLTPYVKPMGQIIAISAFTLLSLGGLFGLMYNMLRWKVSELLEEQQGINNYKYDLMLVSFGILEARMHYRHFVKMQFMTDALVSTRFKHDYPLSDYLKEELIYVRSYVYPLTNLSKEQIEICLKNVFKNNYEEPYK